jgi:chorismate mutase
MLSPIRRRLASRGVRAGNGHLDGVVEKLLRKRQSRARPCALPARDPVILGHDAAMPDEVPDLGSIRTQIDDVDRRLVALLAERSRLVDRVVHYKRDHHMGVVDRAREDVMLARIGELAKEQGLDPRVAQQVLRTIIDGFTLLEVEELGPDV